MATPATPRNLDIQQGNGRILLTWNGSVGATSYLVEKSTDNVNFTAQSPVTAPQFSDTAVILGTQYWYRVSATNVTTSLPTATVTTVPAAVGEMSLLELRLRAKQRADRVNSDFIVDTEWNSNINQSLMELYDLLVTTYEDYFVARPIKFLSDGTRSRYPLPDGILTFKDRDNNAAPDFVAQPFHKLLGVDLGINNANNAWVTVNKFMFIDRNRFVYPNTASTIYGVFNLQYRLLDHEIEFIPTPTANQPICLWYVPRLTSLLSDNDCTTIGGTGWLEYVIVDAAIKALQKEESDVSVLMAQKQALIERIQSSAVNRDAGMPDKISDVRQNGFWGVQSGGSGWSGPIGGF